MSIFAADPIFSNAKVYQQIAVEALARARSSLAEHRRPREDGSPGHVLTGDLERASFKNSMIAMVFAGMTMEAQLWLHGCERLGTVQYKPIDAQALELRLAPLGIHDGTMAGDMRAFRLARKALVHEKAVTLSQDESPVLVAQHEAEKAVALMSRLISALES